MGADENKKAKTIVEKIKRLLLNCDLTIVYANGEIALRRATMDLCEGSKSKQKQRKFIEAKIDKERYEVFVADIENTKKEILSNLELILDKYNSRYKQVFIMYFFQGMQYQDIAEKTNYSVDMINKIIHKLKEDLLTFYIP